MTQQDKDLDIKDVKAQCSIFESYILSVPDNIQIIICPGNHDPLRIAEPQPPIPEEHCPNLAKRPNITFVSSPSTVRISKSKGFSGIEVLIYHGYSFPFFADKIETLRLNGGLENTSNKIGRAHV